MADATILMVKYASSDRSSVLKPYRLTLPIGMEDPCLIRSQAGNVCAPFRIGRAKRDCLAVWRVKIVCDGGADAYAVAARSEAAATYGNRIARRYKGSGIHRRKGNRARFRQGYGKAHRTAAQSSCTDRNLIDAGWYGQAAKVCRFVVTARVGSAEGPAVHPRKIVIARC